MPLEQSFMIRVSSPHAGVYRPRKWASRTTPRLFPARGGGPRGSTARLARRSSLPRTRGWTAFTGRLWISWGVSSPYAGVDRADASGCPGRPCLFPVRGGVPSGRASPTCLTASLPRTRGWTGLHRHVSGRWIVSSPYAGVDRACRHNRRSGSRLFPARGGGPLQSPRRVRTGTSLPRTRGCTGAGVARAAP